MLRQAWKAKNHFNPRPREEGDFGSDLIYFALIDFNPRPREEGDEPFISQTVKQAISIHALVKRATRPS